jgi:hypothetical protein
LITEAYLDDLKIHDVTGALPYKLALSDFTGLNAPSPRSDRPSKARRHGVYELTTYYDGRAISLEGRVQDTTMAGFWTSVDLLKNRLSLNGLKHMLRWRRTGDSVLYECGVSVAGEVEIDIRAGFTSPYATWAVDLIAADPRNYDSADKTQTFASTAVVTNGGNFNTPVVITFTTPGTNPGLRNDALDYENVIQLAYGGGGSAIVVDTAAREVTLDGVNRPDLVDVTQTNFWALSTGDNHLTKLGGAASITVGWNDAYI